MMNQKEATVARKNLYNEVKAGLVANGKEVFEVEEGLAVEVTDGEFAILKVVIKKEFDLGDALDVMEEKAKKAADKEVAKQAKIAKDTAKRAKDAADADVE